MKVLSSVLKIALGLLALAIVAAPLSLQAENAAPDKMSKAKEKYDADKDGKLSDEEKALAKEGAAAKARQTREENMRKALEKYDANKNGKLDDDEKAQMKADESAEMAAKKAEKETMKAEKEPRKTAKDAGK